MTKQIKACPVCGLEVLHHCWHAGKGDVASVEMPVIAAFKLAEAYMSDLEDNADRYKVQLHKYKRIGEESS